MFSVEYCGYNTRNPDCDIIYRPNGSSSYLFLLILSPMRFSFINYEVVARPGACILYTPGYRQRYQAVKEFLNSYIHFYSDEEFLSRYSFPVNKIFYPKNADDINWFIKKIHREYLTKPPHYVQQMEALINQLLIKIDRDCMHSQQESFLNTALLSDFQSLRLQMLTYCEEDWPVERMCKIVNLEKSQLYSYYKAFFNSTPKTELIHARIDKAKYLLTNEAMQIKQVAQASGFSDIYHFSRYFKKICGCAPSKFAKQKRSSE